MTTFTAHSTSRAWAALAACLLATFAAAAGAVVPARAATVGGSPKTLYVSASATSDPSCATASQTNPFATIAAALACVTNGSTIKLSAGNFAGGFTISRDITLQGAGGSTVITAPSGSVATTWAITIADGHAVTISRLTVDGGTTQGDVLAGAGSLTVVDSVIRNGLGRAGAGIAVAPGAGAGGAALTVLRSTLAGNVGMSGSGGGITLASSPNGGPSNTATVTDSTITDNAGTSSDGGGAWVGTGDSLTVRDSTIADNRDDGFTGSGTVSLTNTILAGNAYSQADCNSYGMTVVDGGHNLIGNGNGCAGFTDGLNGDQVGTPAAPIDPHVAAPAANGGWTPTMALQLGSPAINAGDPAACQAAPAGDKDQRNAKRASLVRRACDIGAYDTAGVALQTLYVKKSAPSDPSCDAASPTNPFATVGAALACASDGTTIKVGAGKFVGGLSVANNVIVQGAGPTTVISASAAPVGSAPVVTISDGHIVTLGKLVVDGGAKQAGVYAGSGALTVVDSTIRNSVGHGGGIGIAPGTGASSVTVLRSTLSGDVGLGTGGGILVAGANDAAHASTVELIDSTVANDLATYSQGGGIQVGSFDSLIVRDSTIAGNDGGGVADGDSSRVTLTNTIVTGSANGQSDCALLPSTVAAGGHDVIGDGDGCTGFADGADGNHVGTSASPLDAGLGALAANGGPTPTMALLSSSPAIGAGDPADCLADPVKGLDQRGAKRNAAARSACDVGAYDTGGAAS